MTVQRCTHSSKYNNIVDNWLAQYYCMIKQPFGSFQRNCSLFEGVRSDSEADVQNTLWESVWRYEIFKDGLPLFWYFYICCNYALKRAYPACLSKEKHLHFHSSFQYHNYFQILWRISITKTLFSTFLCVTPDWKSFEMAVCSDCLDWHLYRPDHVDVTSRGRLETCLKEEQRIISMIQLAYLCCVHEGYSVSGGGESYIIKRILYWKYFWSSPPVFTKFITE